MEATSLGIATLHTRVESWECDFNNHWNARFYGRSFQLAAETVLGFSGERVDGSAIPQTRHIRYHRELFVGAPVEVRSAAISGGRYEGAVVHLLTSGGKLAATALDFPGKGAAALPVIAESGVLAALPRSLTRSEPLPWNAAAPGAAILQLGPSRPAEVDHRGDLLFEEIIRRTAIASHVLLDRLGLTQDFTARTGIGRMAVEIRVTNTGSSPAGTLLQVKGALASVTRKSLSALFHLESQAGNPVATVEHRILAVDLNARRAVELPDFLARFAE